MIGLIRKCLLVSTLGLLSCSFVEQREKQEAWYNSAVVKYWLGDYEDVEALGIPDPRRRQVLIERGQYLVNAVAACGVCHGSDPSDPSTPLSGGRVMYDRFGEVHAANITPDKEAGIGDWNLAQVARAIRSSIGKGGVPLSIDLHASYRWMSNKDLVAISTYLLSQDAVASQVKRRQLGGFERNKWGIIPQHDEVLGYVPEMISPKANDVGRYLSHSVAGCRSCHTVDGGLGVKSSEAFAGGEASAIGGALSGLAKDFGAFVRLFTEQPSGDVVGEEEQVRDLLSEDSAEEVYGEGFEVSAVEETLKAQPELKSDFPALGPSLRSGPEGGLSSWSVSDIVQYMNYGRTKGSSSVDGSFCPWPYYRQMREQDKLAIAQYLKSLS